MPPFLSIAFIAVGVALIAFRRWIIAQNVKVYRVAMPWALKWFPPQFQHVWFIAVGALLILINLAFLMGILK